MKDEINEFTRGLGDLTGSQVTYAIVVVLSLIVPGLTYLMIFHDTILIPFDIKPDFLILILLSLVFSVPFYVLALIPALLREREYQLGLVKSLKNLKEDERNYFLNKASQNFDGIMLPLHAVLYFYATLFMFYLYGYRQVSNVDRQSAFWFFGIFIATVGALFNFFMIWSRPKEKREEDEKLLDKWRLEKSIVEKPVRVPRRFTSDRQ